jgi:ketosteroid isomerase-like protein
MGDRGCVRAAGVIPAAEMAEQRSYKGRDGFDEFMRGWTDDFEEYSVHLERLIDAGDRRVVGLFHQTAMGRGSGVPVRQDYAMVYELADGQLVRMQIYLDRDEALKQAAPAE